MSIKIVLTLIAINLAIFVYINIANPLPISTTLQPCFDSHGVVIHGPMQ